MIGNTKVRVSITIAKESNELFDTFARVLHMTKSEFMEEVCLKFIQDVAENQKKGK